ncbi:MAG: ASCH domain-containing protein [Pseudomonadota bacterium]
MPDLRAKYANLHRFRFADGPELGDVLLSLVLQGKKTGTCWPLRDADTEPMVSVGERAVYTGWNDIPRCVVEYTRVEITRYDQVGEAFALSEGENDSLDGWRADHRAYFERNGGWSPDMELVCENFRVVEVL